MKVIEEGVEYALENTRIGGERPQSIQTIRFVTPNFPGVTNEEVLEALIAHLSYQDNKLPCAESAIAISMLSGALYMLRSRTTDRINRGVEGTDNA